MIVQGDCRDVMATMEPNSIDAIVTDPPYELGFMGRSWDRSGVAFDPATWVACLRVIKPGGYLLAFSGARTQHRMVSAIEDAGFEIRDSLLWMYGSGFPKSLDVSKAIDKAAGAEREVIGRKSDPRYAYDYPESSRPYQGKTNHDWKSDDSPTMASITAPATPEAEQWDGWGTALKPAHEPICLARKPLSEKTVAANVLMHGTGGINIDGCRIESSTNEQNARANKAGDPSTMPASYGGGLGNIPRSWNGASGRWPANVLLDEEAAALLDAQSGERTSGKPSGKRNATTGFSTGITPGAYDVSGYGDTGGASRFYYTAKASRSERNAGLAGMPERDGGAYANGAGMPGRTLINGEWVQTGTWQEPNRTARANHHPTVKPISLMRWLVRLVTPPGGTVLDPFLGSGTTGCAAVLEGVDFCGIDQEEEYIDIARKRIAYWTPVPPPQLALSLAAASW